MTKYEYEKLNKAIFHLMEEEPLNEEECKTWGGGWTVGMNILDDLRREYHKKQIKQQQEEQK